MMPLPARGKTPISRAIVPTRVLVVDYEPLIRWSVCTALAAAGFDAVAASHAQEARRLSAEWPPPKVALLDLRFPKSEGWELVDDIRLMYPDCRFLIMTTAPRGGGSETRRTNGVEVIEKPFDLARLVDVITALAEAPEAERR